MIRRQTALTPISSASSGINPVALHGGQRQLRNLDVRHKAITDHVLSPGTTAGIRCGAGSGLQRTAPSTSFMGQMARVDIRGAFTEPREDGETSPSLCATDDGDAGERDDNPRGRHQDIVVENPLQRTEYWQCGTNARGQFVM